MIHGATPIKHIPRVAVIGSGYWGKNLVRNFHKLGALELICDENQTVLEEFKKQHPETDVCAEFVDVLARKNIEAVVIATPAETHFSLAREALLGGKHVLVEKPLSLTEQEGRELITLAEKRQLILMVGHILHFHPAVIKLKELIESGELGKIQGRVLQFLGNRPISFAREPVAAGAPGPILAGTRLNLLCQRICKG